MDVRGLRFRDVDHLTIRSFTTHGHLTGSSVSAIAEEGARLEGFLFIVDDRLSIRLSTIPTAKNYKQIQFVRANSHVLKRLVSTVRFCPSAPFFAHLGIVQHRMVAPEWQ